MTTIVQNEKPGAKNEMQMLVSIIASKNISVKKSDSQ